MVTALKPLTDRLAQPLTRDDILEAHARNESTQQRWTPAMPYSEVLSIVYKRLGEEWGLKTTQDECVAYGNSVGDWPAFDDSVDALAYLKHHYRLVILSNVDNQSFAASNKRLGIDFDAIYTAEDVGSYKPASRNFEYMLAQLEQLGSQRSEILHTAESMFHDHVPAKEHQLATCWIYRRHQQQGYGATMDPGERPETNFCFNSMHELVTAHQQMTSAS